MTETRQNISLKVKGRRGRAVDKAWSLRMLLLRGGDTLSCRAALRLEEVFAAEIGWHPPNVVKVKEHLRALLRTGSLEEAETVKTDLDELAKAAARAETNRHFLPVVDRDRGAHHHRRHDGQRRGQ